MRQAAPQVGSRTLFLSPQPFRQDRAGGTLRTGVAFAPGPLLVPPTSILAGKWAARTGPAVLAATGGAVFAAGTLWWALALDTDGSYAAGMLPGMLLTGLGVGLMLPTLVAAATTAVPPAHVATGSGVITMLRQLGAVLGVSLVVVLLGTSAGPDASEAFDPVWYLLTVASFAAAATSLFLTSGARTRNTPTVSGDASDAPAAP
ncbi:MAG TPA: MFS transporter [Yinghuangia sp.]|uniref:MFS transporter n=1 Tax=Yinghuangia sp. YIM S10712 TaxID=3436930 RepID=UPI002D1970D1|nr:MFS transporter [Yinghuangia sp.]